VGRAEDPTGRAASSSRCADTLRLTVLRDSGPEGLAIESGDDPDAATARELRGELTRDIRARP
jgi:hypothetical protein